MLAQADNSDLKNISIQIRKNILHMMTGSESSHIGAALSIVEIITILYFKILNINPKEPLLDGRDKFILSKAHSSPAVYSVLAEKGFFPKKYLETFYRNGGILPGHIDKKAAPGIEHSLGSLGHGLPVGIGMAISNKKNGNLGRIFVLLGDGECDEGSVWEGAMLASHLKLDNLTAIIDYNKIQSFGRTDEVINLEPFAKKWQSFGWNVFETNGHDFEDLYHAFVSPHNGRPKMIIAHTIKGKGISFMEDKLEWHYKCPSEDELKLAIEELDNP